MYIVRTDLGLMVAKISSEIFFLFSDDVELEKTATGNRYRLVNDVVLNVPGGKTKIYLWKNFYIKRDS